MVDRLKRAAEHLEAPTCPDCHIEMTWYRSELLANDPVPVIAHLFVCPHCKRTARADTLFNKAGGPPEQLSAPCFVAHLPALAVQSAGLMRPAKLAAAEPLAL